MQLHAQNLSLARRYDFHMLELPMICGIVRRVSAFPTSTAASFPIVMKQSWTADMLARGYTRLATDDVSLGDGTNTPSRGFVHSLRARGAPQLPGNRRGRELDFGR